MNVAGRKSGGLRWPVISALERFEAFVERLPDLPGCWIWTGFRKAHGYGGFYLGGNRPEFAHRASYLLHYGAIPAGLEVLHRCDNQWCVRPDHLMLGTQVDNMRDAAYKGRVRGGVFHGEANPGAKLTDDNVREIRRRYRRGLGAVLAFEYGVDRSLILMIARRVIWRHLA